MKSFRYFTEYVNASVPYFSLGGTSTWPGMGQLILESVLREDIPVAMASFSFIGVFALIAHFLADVSYAFLDPRIRIKSQG